MKNRNVFLILKVILLIVLILGISYVLWEIIPFVKELSTEQGQINFTEKINALGFKGVLMLFGLQVLQILLVVLPGEPFEVLAGMCYGTWGGVLFILLSVFITSSIIFFLVRRIGKKYIYNFFNKEKIDKIQEKLTSKNKAKMEIILCMLFIIPGTPKDLFVYIGGLLPIKPLRFIVIATFARFPSIITSTMVGEQLSNGDLKTSILIYSVTFIITGICIYFVNKKDKNKEISEIMK